MSLKLSYNSPVILSFSLAAIVVFAVDTLSLGVLKPLFSLSGSFVFSNPISYLQLVSYTLGHANLEHLVGNLSLLLLVGPVVEERYGSASTLAMMLVTAVLTAVLHIVLFPYGLLGASGLVFMFIILASFTNAKSGEIPITFILVMLLFVGKEVLNSLNVADNISQFAHIIGGVIGGAFGLLMAPSKNSEVNELPNTKPKGF